ncbi:hypothetical protein LB506_001785 [Fusarium annulatum]|nr:hypothetical protein LB506_001785 [Fusarium annulatum]
MDGQKDRETGLMRDVKDQRLIPAWQNKHGLSTGISRGLGLEPGDVTEARDCVALKKSRSESELGIADVVVSQDRRLFLLGENGCEVFGLESGGPKWTSVDHPLDDRR